MKTRSLTSRFWFTTAFTAGLSSLLLISAPAFSATNSEKTESKSVETTTPKKKFNLNAKADALKLTNDIDTAKKQVEEHPDDPEAHFLLAAAYSRSPYLEQAFKELKKVKGILKDKHDFEFVDRTVSDYEKLSADSPSDTVVLFRLGMGYYLKGYSIEHYSHHFKTPPTETAATYYDKAKATMQKVVQLDPKDIWARDYLGYFESENGKNFDKAISIWEESIEVNSDQNPGAYLLLSQAYLKKGDIQKAASYGAKGLAIKQSLGMTLP